MKIKLKNLTQKFFALTAVLGLSIMAPMISLSSCGCSQSEPVRDPTDPNAYLMVEGKDFQCPTEGLGSRTIKNVVVPSDKKSIKFEGKFISSNICGHDFASDTNFLNLNYLQIGKEFGGCANESQDGFRFDADVFKNKNIKIIILNDTRSNSDDSCSLDFGAGAANNALDGNNTFFFDMDINLINTYSVSDFQEHYPFSVNPETIYIRKSNKGTVEEWMTKLNVTDKSIFKIVG